MQMGKNGVGTVGDLLRLPDLRRIQLGWAASVTGEQAGTVSLVVYAIGAGGAPLAAAYAVSRTLAGMIVTLALGNVANRFRRDYLLRGFTGAGAVLLGAAALTAAVGGPAATVTALAAASYSMSGTYRPLQAAILPWLVRTPAELTASNAVSSTMENSGALAGPLLAGGLLALAATWASIAVAAGCLCMSAASLRKLTVPRTPKAAAHSATHVLHDVVGGITELSRPARPAGLAVLVFAQTFVRGALVVLIAVLAVHVLAIGNSGVGWLNAALGAGGLAGGVAAAAVIGVTRLGRSFVTGVALWGLPLVLLAVAPTLAVACLVFLVVGIGNAVEDVGLFTLVPRLVSAASVSRVLAAVEFIALVGLAAGSAVAPVLLHALGMSGTLALLGAGLASLAVAYAPRFVSLDRAMPAPGPEAALLHRQPMFAPLPLAVTELLASELQPRQYPPGTTVMREGEPGEDFHLIVDGSAAVSVGGTPRPSLARGDCFGEIALLRNIPRTATVTAEQALRTLTLGREAFLAAVTANSTSSAAADTLVTQRLAATPDPPNDRGSPTTAPDPNRVRPRHGPGPAASTASRTAVTGRLTGPATVQTKASSGCRPVRSPPPVTPAGPREQNEWPRSTRPRAAARPQDPERAAAAKIGVSGTVKTDLDGPGLHRTARVRRPRRLDNPHLGQQPTCCELRHLRHHVDGHQGGAHPARPAICKKDDPAALGLPVQLRSVVVQIGEKRHLDSGAFVDRALVAEHKAPVHRSCRGRAAPAQAPLTTPCPRDPPAGVADGHSLNAAARPCRRPSGTLPPRVGIPDGTGFGASPAVGPDYPPVVKSVTERNGSGR
jgi:CRP-like cAMP-binding protein